MKKSELANLKIGVKVISKKDNSIHTITGRLNDRLELDEEIFYSISTIIRWFNIYEEQVEEIELPIQVDILDTFNNIQLSINTKVLASNGMLTDELLEETARKVAEEKGYQIVDIVFPDYRADYDNRVGIIVEGLNTGEDTEKRADDLSEGSKGNSDILTMNYIENKASSLGLTIKVNKTNTAIRYGKKNVMEVQYSKRKNHFTLFVRYEALSESNKIFYKEGFDGKIVGKGYSLNFTIKTISANIFSSLLQEVSYWQYLQDTKDTSIIC